MIVEFNLIMVKYVNAEALQVRTITQIVEECNRRIEYGIANNIDDFLIYSGERLKEVVKLIEIPRQYRDSPLWWNIILWPCTNTLYLVKSDTASRYMQTGACLSKYGI